MHHYAAASVGGPAACVCDGAGCKEVLLCVFLTARFSLRTSTKGVALG